MSIEKMRAIESLQEMTDGLEGVPDKWFDNLLGFIVVICTTENVGVNASLSIRDDLTVDQKIGIIAQISQTLDLQYEILREYMDVTNLDFSKINEGINLGRQL